MLAFIEIFIKIKIGYKHNMATMLLNNKADPTNSYTNRLFGNHASK